MWIAANLQSPGVRASTQPLKSGLNVILSRIQCLLTAFPTDFSIQDF
jgi:hypothetical protein